MTKRDRAYDFAKRISEVYNPDKVVVCWNFNMARKYNAVTWIPETVAYACIYEMEHGDDVQAIVPVAKRVLFNDNFDFTDDLLLTVGRFLIQHYQIEGLAGFMKG